MSDPFCVYYLPLRQLLFHRCSEGEYNEFDLEQFSFKLEFVAKQAKLGRDMNYFRHLQNRRRRKLPHVQRKQHGSSIFWPSFHGALAWMRKNQETIDTAVKLLEIYPSLIQDRSLDVLWDFLSPFFGVKPTKSTSSDNLTTTNTKSDEEQCTATIPSIYVTGCDDNFTENLYGMPSAASNLPKICVVGDSSNGSTNFLRLVQDISLFSLTNKSPVHESDACIFLMNNENISNKDCYRDLVLASTLDIPTLFVKPLGFKLPSPLPDTVIQFALFNNESETRRRNINFNGSVRNTKINRSGSAQGYTNIIPKYPFVRHDSDLVILLVDGYRKSIDYDFNNHDVSVKTLKESIEQITKINLSSAKDTTETVKASRNCLSVPNPDASIPWMESCDTEYDDELVFEAADSPDLSLEGRSLSELSEVDIESTLSEKETFYFVANERFSSGKIVKWPPSRPGTLSESSTYSDSPISFNNLDFENFHNDKDLLDSDSSSEMN